MKTINLINMLFMMWSIGCVESDSGDTYTLDQPFIITPLIPYQWSISTALAKLSTNDIFVSNSTSITFKLTNGSLSSGSSGDTYYLKNQTGERYPAYALKQGQAKPGDVSIFKATRDSSLFGRSIEPNITTDVMPGSGNLWVACLTNDNLFIIGWDADAKSQPPERCINYAKYNPGVILHVQFQ